MYTSARLQPFIIYSCVPICNANEKYISESASGACLALAHIMSGYIHITKENNYYAREPYRYFHYISARPRGPSKCPHAQGQGGACLVKRPLKERC